MPKIKFDLRDTDPEAANEGAFEDPKPGVYTAKIHEANPGFSKGDSGKPDKKRPRVEVVFEIIDDKYKGARLWLYLTFGSGFPAQKLDQFLQALNIASKDKRQGEFDTDAIIGKVVKIRVKAGKKQDGSYRPEVGAVFANNNPTNSTDGIDDEDIFGDEDGDGGDEVPFDADTTAGDEWEVDGDHIYTADELIVLELAQVKEVAALYDDTTAYRSKDKAIAAVIAAQSEWCAANDVEDPNVDAGDETGGDDEDIFGDEDDAIIDDDADGFTEDQLGAMTVPELKAAADSVGYEIVKGSKKSTVIAGILEAQFDTPF